MLGLGRSFQDSRLFPSLTVEEVLLVALERWLDVRDPLTTALKPAAVRRQRGGRPPRGDELVELLGLGAFRSKFVSELSTGSPRVVGIGCVLATARRWCCSTSRRPASPRRKAEALGPLLLGIRDSLDANLVVIEHDMSLISSVSDRLVALDQGRLVTDGPPADVLAHPAVVESYLGGDAAVIRRSGATQPAATLREPAMTPGTATPPPRASVFARFGPLVAVLVALSLVAGFASTGRGTRPSRPARARWAARASCASPGPRPRRPAPPTTSTGATTATRRPAHHHSVELRPALRGGPPA
ncbi:hypothetical protein KSP35_00015 [Aquihabitans sp. G128]|uniref:ABC transporter ATP-binding protein C-terminal domain-containing protein n=1 Tax=Aquihabitans sp. G128 TaxID=2849779 RepID=UPI001C215921|nr:hypothetical protein [Aquihabitans sp. G128]QXC61281.1 hypothetical protein KSP35_00015 [Aquihabitans sp. G128]